MYPHERSLVRLMAGKPFAIVGVNSDSNVKTATEACRKKNLTWRSFINEQEGTNPSISKDWRVTAWPTTYLIDADGIIRYRNVRGDALDKAIERLMAEMNENVKIVGVDHEAEDKKMMTAFKNKIEELEPADSKPESNEKGSK